MSTKYLACPECDLFIALPVLAAGNKACCPRCHYILTASHYNALDRVMAFAITAFVFLLLASFFPFLSINVQGQERTITLLQSISVLVSQHFSVLAVIIFIPVILGPAIYLLLSIYLCLSLKARSLYPHSITAMKFVSHLQHWNMAEIFLIGILVSFIKIISLAEVTLGPSFWAYVLFIPAMSAVSVNIDKYQFWQWIKRKQGMPVFKPVLSPASGINNFNSCPMCASIMPLSSTSCGFCGTHVDKRVKHSIQKTWAWLITAVVLYIPANILPIMKVKYLGEESSNTILGGVIVLWQHGSYPVALIIFIASVLVPIGKILTLAWLCYSVQNGKNRFCKQKTILYRRTELVGRWSMIDVFVVVVLVALIRMGTVMSVYPGPGVLAFCGLVIVTMLAAISFDSRLIWDHGACAEYNKENS